jgi:flagellar biosynthesis protein
MTDRFDDGPGKPGKNPFIPLNIKEKSTRQVAVALTDAGGENALPTVTAAGRGKIAEQILQLAFENGIRVREDSALAEMLAALELDSPIPNEALVAVAEILSYVYKANGAPNPFDAPLGDDKHDTDTPD